MPTICFAPQPYSQTWALFLLAATPHLLCVCVCSFVQVRTCMTVLQLCSLRQESCKAAAAQSYRPLGAKACISTARRPGTGRRPEPTGSPSTAIPVRTICCSRGHIVISLYALSRAYSQTWLVENGAGERPLYAPGEHIIACVVSRAQAAVGRLRSVGVCGRILRTPPRLLSAEKPWRICPGR